MEFVELTMWNKCLWTSIRGFGTILHMYSCRHSMIVWQSNQSMRAGLQHSVVGRSNLPVVKDTIPMFMHTEVTSSSCCDTLPSFFLYSPSNLLLPTLISFLPARRSKRCPCYCNVSGWVAGWLPGCPSHAGIVSKRLNLSENFFNHLKAPSF